MSSHYCKQFLEKWLREPDFRCESAECQYKFSHNPNKPQRAVLLIAMKPSGNNLKAAQNMKQKTLKSFFTKPTPSATPSTKSSSKSKPATDDASKSKSSVALRESEAKATESPVLDSSQSSYADSNVKDTPPTSDYIDVDMVLDEDTNVKAKSVREIFIFCLNYDLFIDER